MTSGKMVLTIVPSIMTSEIAREMKSKPIHRVRDVAMTVTAFSQSIQGDRGPFSLESCQGVYILKELTDHFARHRHTCIPDGPEVILSSWPGGNRDPVVIDRRFKSLLGSFPRRKLNVCWRETIGPFHQLGHIYFGESPMRDIAVPNGFAGRLVG